MRTWTWKRWTVGVLTLVVVAALTYWASASLRDDGSPVIAEPSTAPSASEPTVPAPTDGEPTASEEPTEEPSQDDPGGGPISPPSATTWMVTTDGADVVLRSDDGGDVVTLYESPDGAETTVAYVAVRPGSTPEDLTVVFTRSREGMYDLWHASVRDRAEPAAEAFPDPYQVSPDIDPASHPFPVWSPEGRHVAWTELPADGGDVVLRTIGWSDGPGTGAEATDNAAFTLGGLPVVATTVEEWIWNGGGTATTGSLVVTTGEVEAYRVGIERQADGALARPATGEVDRMMHPDGAVIDQADGRTGPTPETSSLYTLVATGGTDGTVELQLTVIEGSDQGDDLTLPADLERTSDPGSRWMVAGGDTVLIGDGGGVAWLLHRHGGTRELTGTVRSGDIVG